MMEFNATYRQRALLGSYDVWRRRTAGVYLGASVVAVAVTFEGDCTKEFYCGCG